MPIAMLENFLLWAFTGLAAGIVVPLILLLGGYWWRSRKPPLAHAAVIEPWPEQDASEEEQT